MIIDENVNMWSVSDPEYMIWTDEGRKEGTPDWSVSKCFACKKYSLWIEKDLAYPYVSSPHFRGGQNSNHVPHVDMPADAAELFNEAVAVLPYSKRAAAALCRASMERLVKGLTKDAVGKKKNLDDRLVILQSEVSTPTIQGLNFIRYMGNMALHGDGEQGESAVILLTDTDAGVADVFFKVMNSLVDELITKPKTYADLHASLPEGVRKSFEDKVAKHQAEQGKPQ
ncbi:DUF4145 domain-containing protein [Arthrobacter sp. Leaf234]|uniref:DUF4145 domain-containing protein n=1 Tax=Arthrobacter sp. Leaf234 TaxID=1736303 RepID=UPI00138F9D0C|nr:DUF4145 domain-containing protein [Arthrobacter sp. Leaf234]